MTVLEKMISILVSEGTSLVQNQNIQVEMERAEAERKRTKTGVNSSVFTKAPAVVEKEIRVALKKI